jgi:phage-related protein
MLQIKINGLTLGAKTNYQIQSPISGLEKPPIRMGAGDWSGRDGGYVSSQFYGTRVIVISGFYIGSSCEEADELRLALTEALPIRQSLPFYFTTFGGKLLFSQTYIRDMKMDITNPTSGQFQITLIAPDPFLYDAGDGVDPDSGWLELPVYKLIGGGYITEYNMPVQWTPGTTPTVAVNSGDVLIYPQFKIVGAVTNPIITNLSENKFVKINVTTTNPTDEIIIDMGQRTVTLNGGSILSFRTLDSTWWGLPPGNSSIQFETDGVGDITFGTLRWRTAYQGA